MSTGSGGSDDVDREPALFNSAKDFSMITLGKESMRTAEAMDYTWLSLHSLSYLKESQNKNKPLVLQSLIQMSEAHWFLL